MFGRKHDFKPDRTDSGALNKLYITKKQRLSLLKWFLFGLVLLVLSLVQDVVMSRLTILGGTTDLVCGGIFLCCLLISVDSSAVFALCASIIYYFAGFSPGVHCIILLTAFGVFLNMLRHNYLRKNFFSVILCQQSFHFICNFFWKCSIHTANLIWQFFIITNDKPFFSRITGTVL